MATLSESFTTLFDKALQQGHGQMHRDQWTVAEYEKNATMTRLQVNGKGIFVGFDHNLVSGVADVTTRMSSKLEDKDCDGIAFWTDSKGEEHLVFVELKSGFDIGKITGAFHQITMSFIKKHAWLSLCKHYDLRSLKIHFVVACKCFKDKNQEADVMHRISAAQQLGKTTFEAILLHPLLKGHHVKIRMSSIRDIEKLPFHDAISRKDITMHLQLTETHADSQAQIALA